MYNISNITYYITIDSGAWRGAVNTRVTNSNSVASYQMGDPLGMLATHTPCPT